MKYFVLAFIATFMTAQVSSETLYTLTKDGDSFVFSPVVDDDPVDDTTDDDTTDDDTTDDDTTDDPVVYDDPAMQEIQYCQNFDTSQGLTFSYVEWQRRCDTNKDGEYKFCEDWSYPGPINFSYVWWYRGCQDDPAFTPVPKED